MNGFADRGLDEASFGDKKGISEGLRTFDAFRKHSSQLVAPSSSLSLLVLPSLVPAPPLDRVLLPLTSSSKNQTHLYPPQLHRRVCHSLSTLCLIPALHHRAPPLVPWARNAPFQRRKGYLARLADQSRHRDPYGLHGPACQRTGRQRRPNPCG